MDAESSRHVPLSEEGNRQSDGGRPPMRVHSATSRSSSPLSSTPLPVTSAPAVPAPRSPRDWVRQWFGGRGGSNPTRLTSAEQRASHRLAQLGSAWQVVPWGRSRQRDHEGFLAVGPGGVFAVTVVDQGRHRVMMAGDVVQIHGRRPPLVSRARRAARRASEALTAAVGAKVPVVPVLTPSDGPRPRTACPPAVSWSPTGSLTSCCWRPERRSPQRRRGSWRRSPAIPARGQTSIAGIPMVGRPVTTAARNGNLDSSVRG